MLQLFIEEREVERCRSLKRVVCSGEALPFDLQQRFFARSGGELHNLYGPTEAAVDVTFWPCERGSERQSVPIGRPIANIQIHLLDGHVQPVPVGVPGELHIGGVGLARGYWQRAALTAERFIPNPLSDQPDERLYKTGDLARRLPDGSIEFLGRIDFQVKVRGFRIELGEIETALEGHPALREAVVLARDTKTAPVRKQLVAYVIANEPLPEKAAVQWVPNLRNYLEEKLPEYMIPAAFVRLDAWPMTPSGKIDRRALPAPLQPTPEKEEGFVPPRNAVEKTLAEIWAEVLGLEQVGVHNNFFELGGDSIHSIQIVARANQAGLQLVPLQLFQRQTIAQLAEVAEPTIAFQEKSHLADESISVERQDFPLVRLDRSKLARLLADIPDVDDVYPLSPMQEDMLFHKLHMDESGLYVIHHLFVLQGITIDASIFERAWQYVINRNAPLRTSFIWEGLDEPLQIVHQQARVHLKQGDWRDLPPDVQLEKLADYIAQVRRRGFDPTQVPHTDIALWQVAENVYYFVYTFDFMMQDGWSYPLIQGEVFAAYAALSAGLEPDLEPARPHRDFIAWVQRQDLSQAEAFWRRTLQGINMPTPALVDRASDGPSDEEPVYIKKALDLTPELTAALSSLARQHRLTLYTLMQGAWALLLSAYSGQDDLVFGSVVSGRTTDLDNIEYRIGHFLNFLPVRTKVLPETSLLPWLEELQAQSLEMRKYQYTPLKKVHQWCGVPRDRLLFESYLVFENFPVPQSLVEQVSGVQFTLDHSLAQTEHALRVIFMPGAGLRVEICYYNRHFRAATIEAMLDHFQTIAQGMAAHPDQRLSDLMHLIEPE